MTRYTSSFLEEVYMDNITHEVRLANCKLWLNNASHVSHAGPSMPAGCALDFSVTDDGRTLLIEMNGGYSLGLYGLEPTLHAKLLTARWQS